MSSNHVAAAGVKLHCSVSKRGRWTYMRQVCNVKGKQYRWAHVVAVPAVTIGAWRFSHNVDADDSILHEYVAAVLATMMMMAPWAGAR